MAGRAPVVVRFPFFFGFRALRSEKVQRMAHDIAKAMLEKAETPLLRQKAVRVAVRLGMPLHEIEAYLDWLDMVRHRQKKRDESHSNKSADKR